MKSVDIWIGSGAWMQEEKRFTRGGAMEGWVGKNVRI